MNMKTNLIPHIAPICTIDEEFVVTTNVKFDKHQVGANLATTTVNQKDACRAAEVAGAAMQNLMNCSGELFIDPEKQNDLIDLTLKTCQGALQEAGFSLSDHRCFRVGVAPMEDEVVICSWLRNGYAFITTHKRVRRQMYSKPV